jgi:hypothetical protein
MRRPPLLLGAVALAIATAVAGCGGGDAEVSTEETTTSSSSAATTSTVGSAGCTVPGATVDAKTATADVPVALLTDIRTGRQPCADRVVFEFNGAAPPGFTVEYQPGPFTFGESSEPLAIDGSAFLVVRFYPASNFDLSKPDAPQTSTTPDRATPSGLSHVREIRRLEDFEAVMVWVIGLDSSRPFTVAMLTGPSRVYVDIA